MVYLEVHKRESQLPSDCGTPAIAPKSNSDLMPVVRTSEIQDNYFAKWTIEMQHVLFRVTFKFRDLPVYNHLQSNNGEDGQDSPNKCVHNMTVKQTAS